VASKKSSVISVLITGDNKGLSGALDDSSSKLASFGKAAGVALAAAGVAFAAFAKSGLDAAIETEAAQARLATLLRNTGLASEEQIEGLNAQAAALERVGVAAGSNITVLQAQLATFDLSADAIKTLTPAIVDYVIAEKGAAATSGDFQAAANGLAQALQGNFGALSRVGFVLDDVTKEMIANGTEAERAAALVDVLGSTYDGFNEKARETAAGGLQVLKNQFGAIKESVGTALLPVLRTFIDWFQGNEARITAFADKVIGGLLTAIGFIGEKFTELRPKIAEVVDFFRDKSAEFKTFFEERLRDPINEVRTAIGTFVDTAKTKFAEFSGFIPSAVKAFTDFIGEIRALADDPKALGTRLGEALSDALRTGLEALLGMSEEINASIRGLLAKVDWFGLGRSAITYLIQFGLGFAAAFLAFEWLVPVLSSIRENLGVILLGAISVALAPAAVVGRLAAILGRIPLAGRFIAWALTALNRLGAAMRDRIALVFQSFGQAFTNAIARLGPGIISRFVTFLRGLPQAVSRMFDDVALNVGLGFSRFGAAVGNAVVRLVTKFRELMSFLLRPFTNFGKTLADDLFNIGKNVIDALIRGLRSMGSKLFDVVKGIGSSIYSTLSQLWKISSPSKVFMGIGEDAMDGLALGLAGSERMLRQMTAGIGDSVLPSVTLNAASGSGQSPAVINVTVTSADPQAVVDAIRRYTRSNGPLSQVVTV
jgi:hypothetical protein